MLAGRVKLSACWVRVTQHSRFFCRAPSGFDPQPHCRSFPSSNTGNSTPLQRSNSPAPQTGGSHKPRQRVSLRSSTHPPWVDGTSPAKQCIPQVSWIHSSFVLWLSLCCVCACSVYACCIHTCSSTTLMLVLAIKKNTWLDGLHPFVHPFVPFSSLRFYTLTQEHWFPAIISGAA